jgi:hypothetical protein
LGNYLDVLINNNIQAGGFFSHYQGASYFWLFAGIMAANAALYYILIPIFGIRDTVTHG